MTCARIREVERTLSPADLRSFCEHAAQCPDCAVILERLDGAYAVLRAEAAPPLSASRRALLRERIAEHSETPRRRLGWLAIPALVTALGLALWTRTPPRPAELLEGAAVAANVHLEAGDALAPDVPVALEPAARLRYRDAELRVDRASTLGFHGGPGLEPLELDSGRVRFDVPVIAPPDRFAVETPLARFELVGGRFVLDVEPDRVELSVEVGRVRLLPADGKPAREILEGETALVERRRIEPVAAVPPPALEAASEADQAPPPRPQPREEKRRKVEPAALEPPRAPAPAIPTPEARLDEARKVVTQEPAKARELAQGVLEEKPEPALEIGALLVLADAHRRTGEWRGAAEAYDRVAAHAKGAPYAEEALLRRAQILAGHAEETGAIGALARAAERFPLGPLAPERAVLEAKLHLERRDAIAAARALERVGSDRTMAVLRARVDVAEVLVLSSPERAAALLAPVLEGNVSPELNARARMIVSKVAGNR